MIAALVALACAVLVVPARTRVSAPPRRRGFRWSAGWGAAGLTVVALSAMVVLPAGAVVAAALAIGTLTLRTRRAAARRRRAAEAAALRAALDVVAGELRAGAHPVTAFDTAAIEVSDEMAPVLRAVAARARLGVDVSTGLHSAAAESAIPSYWNRLAVCWEMAHRHGLAIALLMRTAHRDLVERDRFESRVTAGMAGARTTAGVLAALPVLGIGLGQLVGADPVRFLLSDGLGGWLLAIGALLSCTGLLWSDRITAGTLT